MRVAVRHTDKEHPNGQWFAFGEGRILGFTDPISGTSYSAEQVSEALLNRAREQFPVKDGYEHQIETLHVSGTDKDGNEVGEWCKVGTSNNPRVGQGNTLSHELVAEQGQEADSA